MLDTDSANYDGFEQAIVPRIFEGVDWAVPDDEDAIYEMLMQLHAENGAFSVAPSKVRETIRLGTMRELGMIGVIRGANGLEASVGMVLEQYWYTNDWYLGERWNFVLPDYRKSTHAQKLIEFSKWCSERMDIPLVMGIITTKQTEAKLRLYRRHLLPVGGFFVHNMPGLKAVDPAEASINPRNGKVDV